MDIREDNSSSSNELYQLIMDNINDLICIVENKYPFKVKYVNEPAFWNLMNYFNKDLIDQPFLNYIHPDDLDKVVKKLKKGVVKGDAPQEIRFKSKNERYFWFDFKVRKIEENAHQHKLLIVLKNSTKSKDLEEKIREFEFKLRNLMSSIPEIRFWKLFYPKKYEEALKTSYDMLQNVIDNIPESIFWKDINLTYLGCNKNYANLIGIEKSENIIGESDKDLLEKKLLLKERVVELEKKENKIIQSNKAEYHNIEPCRLKNEKETWLDVNRIPLYDSEGNVVGILVTYEDISEIKKAEVELKESEEKFRTISERSLLGIFIIQDDVIKYANQRASETLGYSIEEMKSWTSEKYLKLFFPEDRERIVKLWKQEQIGLDGDVNIFKIRYIKSSGKTMWTELFAKSFQYKGRPAVLVSAIDISESKKAEEELVESEEKYRHLFESSPNMIFLFDVNRKLIDINAALINYLGLRKEDLIGKDFLEPFNLNEEELKVVEERFKELLKKGHITPLEFRFTRENKPSIWVSIQASFIEIGIRTLIEVIMQDITDRKRSEEILKLNGARLEALLKLSQMANLSENEISKFALTKCSELTASEHGCLFLLNDDQSFMQFIYQSSTLNNIYDSTISKDSFYEKLNIWKEILIAGKPVINNKKTEKIDLFPSKLNIDKEIKRYMFVPILEGNQIVVLTCVMNKKNNYDEADIHQLSLFMDGVWKNIQRKRSREALSNSERKYRELIDTSSMGLVEYDFINNKISYVNPKVLNIFGFDENDKSSLDEFIKNNKKYFFPEGIAKFHKIIDKETIDVKIHDKSGNIKWLLGKVIKQTDENGKVTSLRIWLEDITEKKMYEELIFELNVNFLNFTTDIQKNIGNLLQTVKKLLNSEVVLYVHKRYQEAREIYYLMDTENKVFTVLPEDFSNNFFISELFQENHDYTQTIFNIDETKYSQTDPYINKFNVKVCYGKLIKSQNEFNSALCVFYQKNPIISHQDKLVLFLVCDAIEIEQRRWQVQQNLEEQNKFKSELLSRTSHELKTPLISIKGFTELLLTVHKADLDTDVISILEEVKEGSNRLERLVNSLLRSSRLEQGQLKLNITTEDLSFLIKFCVKELQGLAELRKHKIKLNIHEYLTCNFDKERVYEVVSNLLLNAIKYTPPGGTISIKSEVKEKNYVISIEDTGIGITEEEKSILFKQFGKIERYGKGWDVDIEGSGLGLFISKKIIELHGGKIWVESEGRNRGSKFYFSLPIVS